MSPKKRKAETEADAEPEESSDSMMEEEEKKEGKMEDVEIGGGGGGATKPKGKGKPISLPFHLLHKYDEKSERKIDDYLDINKLPSIKIEEAACLLYQAATRAEMRTLLLEAGWIKAPEKARLLADEKGDVPITFAMVMRCLRSEAPRRLNAVWPKLNPDDRTLFCDFVRERHAQTERRKKQKRVKAQKAAAQLKAELMTEDTLRPMLHKLYSQTHSYRQPSVVQVVGWTENRVLTRYVKLAVNDDGHGGSAQVDAKWLEAHPPPKTPLTKATEETKSMQICDDDGEPYLKINNDSQFFLSGLAEKYHWCEY